MMRKQFLTLVLILAGATSASANAPGVSGRSSIAPASTGSGLRANAMPSAQSPRTTGAGLSRSMRAGSSLGQPASASQTAAPQPSAAHAPSASPGELRGFREADRLTSQERSAGLHINRVTTTLAGNSHFHGWWDVVPHDTSIVVVQGSAYAGRKVTVGWEAYDNAAIIYVKPEAGLREQTHLDVRGTAGEQVRVLYYRVAPSARIETRGNETLVSNTGQSAGIGGDPHFRDVHLTIQPTNSETAQPVSSLFNHYQVDSYDQTARQQGRDTRGPKASNALGGDADEARFQARSIDPMMH